MLIIGHRGAAAEKPENTLASIRAALASGAHIIEFDVRLTKDNQPVLAHDHRLFRTHRIADRIKDLTLKELTKRTGGSSHPICTLKEALSEIADKAMINIELKDPGSGKVALEVCRDMGFASKDALERILFTSFSPRELHRLRKLNKRLQLGLLHHVNPYLFLIWQRRLNLQAVGFHRLHVPRIAIELAHTQDMFTFAYTVNRTEAARLLQKKGLDGIATDYPTTLVNAFSDSQDIDAA